MSELFYKRKRKLTDSQRAAIRRKFREMGGTTGARLVLAAENRVSLSTIGRIVWYA